MNVYQIDFDWKYRTFEPLLTKDEVFERDQKFGRGKSLLKKWQTHGVGPITKKPIAHFFTTFSRSVMGITERVLELPTVNEMLQQCGELLPMTGEDQKLWLFHCLNTVDSALNYEKTQIDPEYHNLTGEPVFRPDLAVKEWFFIIPESCARLFATETFFDYYHHQKWTGLEFQLQKVSK